MKIVTHKTEKTCTYTWYIRKSLLGEINTLYDTYRDLRCSLRYFMDHLCDCEKYLRDADKVDMMDYSKNFTYDEIIGMGDGVSNVN